jgi:hypothetical protein
VSGEKIKQKVVSKREIRKICESYIRESYGHYRHEWAYTKIDKKLIVEEFIPDAYGDRLTDVKFDCFHGVPTYILVKLNIEGGSLHSLLDAEANRLDVEYKGTGEVPDEVIEDLQTLLPELRHYASRLSEDFDYCRVDFYLTPNGPYFGEITHYPASGTRRMTPQSFASEMGQHWNLDAHNSVFSLWSSGGDS